VKKIAFPSELLPVYAVVVNHVYLLIGYALLVAMEWIINGSLPLALVWLPAILAVQFLFISGLAMFLSAANIFVRDVMQLVPVAIVFWMFTTPVFYDLTAVAVQADAKLEASLAQVARLSEEGAAPPGELARAERELEQDQHAAVDINRINALMQANPMATVLSLHRSIWTYGKIPVDKGKLLRFGLLAVVVQILGYAFFLRCKGRFSDEV
jgi:ABC-type polysaccharide/polyol phosphate export permease